jgi:hypothetical protein
LLQLCVKCLLHRNKEGIQINMEDTARHETTYKLAHRIDKANFSSFCYPKFRQINDGNVFCCHSSGRELMKLATSSIFAFSYFQESQ